MIASDSAFSFAGLVPSNVFVALASAAAWGGGDFAGGMGVKAAGGTTRGALRVTISAHSVSLLVLLIVLAAQRAPLPGGTAMCWGLGAGVAAGSSVVAFYLALARGAMGASAAISGLLAAAIPVAVSETLEGAPATLQAAGFLLAGVAIWIIAAAPTPHDAAPSPSSPARRTMALAIFGGTGFGIYFTALRQANSLGVLEPAALARTGSLVTCLVLLVVLGRGTRAGAGTKARWLGKRALLWALGVALLDTGGNLLYIAATRLGRLDVAAVLASLYPAGTILLAAWQLHERPTRRQAAGMALALAAVVMITA